MKKKKSVLDDDRIFSSYRMPVYRVIVETVASTDVDKIKNRLRGLEVIFQPYVISIRSELADEL